MAQSLPGVVVTIQDNALGIVPASSNQIEVKIGVCSAGIAGQLYSIGDLQTLSSSLGVGPVVESAADALSVSGSPLFILPANPSVQGGATAVSAVAVGTGTVEVTFAPGQVIVLDITTDGYAGGSPTPQGYFTYTVGSGTVSAPVAIPNTPFIVPGTLTSVQFLSTEYIEGDTFILNLDGTITHTGSGAALSSVTSSPLDVYQAQVVIESDGYRSSGTFELSLDDGNSFGPETQIPSSGVYVVAGTGLVLTFSSGDFLAGDQFTFETVSAGFTNTDLTNSFALLTSTYRSAQFSMIHVVGMSASASAAAAESAVIDLGCNDLFNLGKFVIATAECPTVGSIIPGGSPGQAAIDTADTDTVLETAFQNFVSPFTLVGAGDCDLTSSLTGRINRRNLSTPMMSRLSLVNPGTDGAKTLTGPLPGVLAIYRNEEATPGLNAARFCTLRTYDGLFGFFLTGVNTMAQIGSDFGRAANRRVINEAATIVRQGALLYINDDLTLNSDGTINEVDAQQIESTLNGKLQAAMVQVFPQDCSNTQVSVNRTTNIAATSTLYITVRVQPNVYSSFININLGFAVSL